MLKLLPYLKAIAAALFPAMQLLVAAQTEGGVSSGEWRDVGTTAAMALVVFLVPAPGYVSPVAGDAPVDPPPPTQDWGERP